MSTTQRLLKRIENELKALKASTPLNFGALRFPDEIPTASYSGTFDGTEAKYVVARVAATFTRTDSEASPPMVDFAFDFEISPDYVESAAQQGVTITGSDPSAIDEYGVIGYEAETGTNSVTFYIDVLGQILVYAVSTITLNVTVQANSTVEGTLTLERLI